MARLKDLFLVAAVMVTSSSLSAATLTVDLNGGADYTDIQEAIDAASDGDTVLVKPGEYVITEPINFNRLHKPDDPASPPVKNITVKSESGGEVTKMRMAETPLNPKRASVAIFENGEGMGSKLDGFTLTGGKGTGDPSIGIDPRGGGVFCLNSSPTLINCTITGNSAVGLCFVPQVARSCGIGGGAYCDFSSPVLINCTISGNSAATHGGGVACGDNSSPILTNCTISGNSAWCDGGGVYSCGNSSPTLTNCIVWDNSGGSVYVDESNLSIVITYSCIEGEPVWAGEGNINQDPLLCDGWRERQEVWVDPSLAAPGDGSEGNPYSDPHQATIGYSFSSALSIESPCWGTAEGGSDMEAHNGSCDTPAGKSRIVHLAAGMYESDDFDLARRVSLQGSGQDRTIIQGTLRGLRTRSLLSNLTITKGMEGGIVIAVGENPEITDCTIASNYALGQICGVFCGVSCREGSSPTLTNCTISENSGGGVSCGSGCSPILTSCTISGNNWGGVSCGHSSSPTLTRCTISGNLDTGMYCENSSATLTACTIWGNSGGGVYSENSSLILTNCMISGNSAGPYGGLYCGGESSPTLTNCTISGNTAEWGGGGNGGVSCGDNSSPTLTNCIVWGNTLESVCGNLSNCLTDQDPLFIKPGEWVDCGSPDDPLCIAYAWNPDTGEPTAWHRWVFDYHLQPGSPAVDAGTYEGAPATDIEGNPRPCWKGIDIGAYEYCGETPPVRIQQFKRGDSNADSRTDISDGVAILNYLFLGGTNVPCEQAGDANDDGLLDISDGIYVLNFLFTGGKAIEPPVGECGIDPTGHDLLCGSFLGCL